MIESQKIITFSQKSNRSLLKPSITHFRNELEFLLVEIRDSREVKFTHILNFFQLETRSRLISKKIGEDLAKEFLNFSNQCNTLIDMILLSISIDEGIQLCTSRSQIGDTILSKLSSSNASSCNIDHYSMKSLIQLNLRQFKFLAEFMKDWEIIEPSEAMQQIYEPFYSYVLNTLTNTIWNWSLLQNTNPQIIKGHIEHFSFLDSKFLLTYISTPLKKLEVLILKLFELCNMDKLPTELEYNEVLTYYKTMEDMFATIIKIQINTQLVRIKSTIESNTLESINQEKKKEISLIKTQLVSYLSGYDKAQEQTNNIIEDDDSLYSFNYADYIDRLPIFENMDQSLKEIDKLQLNDKIIEEALGEQLTKLKAIKDNFQIQTEVLKCDLSVLNTDLNNLTFIDLSNLKWRTNISMKIVEFLISFKKCLLFNHSSLRIVYPAVGFLLRIVKYLEYHGKDGEDELKWHELMEYKKQKFVNEKSSYSCKFEIFLGNLEKARANITEAIVSKKKSPIKKSKLKVKNSPSTRKRKSKSPKLGKRSRQKEAIGILPLKKIKDLSQPISGIEKDAGGSQSQSNTVSQLITPFIGVGESGQLSVILSNLMNSLEEVDSLNNSKEIFSDVISLHHQDLSPLELLILMDIDSISGSTINMDSQNSSIENTEMNQNLKLKLIHILGGFFIKNNKYQLDESINLIYFKQRKKIWRLLELMLKADFQQKKIFYTTK